MSPYLLLQTVLTLGLLAMIVFVILVLAHLRRTLAALEGVLSQINKELPSLIVKLQIAMDGVNSELGRMDDIVQTFQEVSASVQNTTGAVRNVVTSPVIGLVSAFSGARAALSSLLGRKRTRPGAEK